MNILQDYLTQLDRESSRVDSSTTISTDTVTSSSRDIVAIDFETASLEREACSLGVVKYEDGQVTFRENFTRLSRPPLDYWLLFQESDKKVSL